jgi:hypothetical protein
VLTKNYTRISPIPLSDLNPEGYDSNRSMVEALVKLNAVIIMGPLSSKMMLININIQIETIQMTEVILISHCRTSQ